jgi:superfamily I DNA/RNA helicase
VLCDNDVLSYLGRYPRPLVTFKKAGVLRFEAAPMLYDILLNNRDKFGDVKSCVKRIAAYEAVWSRLQKEEPGWAPTSIDQDFETAIIDWLTFHKAMLIGELVPHAFHYLRDNPECSILQQYDHIIVDEFQDLN